MTRLTLGAGIATLAALVAVAQPAAAQQAPKIGYVNSRQILQAMPGYTSAESTYTSELQGFRVEIQRLQATFDSSAQAFEQSSVALSPSARTAKRKELQDQQTRLEQRMAELQQRAQDRERELLDPIESRMNAIIEGVRAAGNYAMVFDVSSPGSAIVAADKSLDLTQRVIQQIQASGN